MLHYIKSAIDNKLAVIMYAETARVENKLRKKQLRMRNIQFYEK